MCSVANARDVSMSSLREGLRSGTTMAVRPRGAVGDARQVPIVIGTNDRDLVASNSPTAPIQRLCFANDRHRKQADLLVNRVTIRSEPVYNFRTIQPHRLIRDTKGTYPKQADT